MSNQKSIPQKDVVYTNETEFVLNNPVLMAQIELSEQTHQNKRRMTTFKKGNRIKEFHRSDAYKNNLKNV